MRRYITFVVISLIVVIGAIIGISYLMSTHSVKVSFDHAHDVSIIDGAEAQEGGSAKVIHTVTKSGDSFRIPKNSSYIVTYKGDSDYSDGTAAINNTDSTITITPDYSKAKYQELLASNSSAIIKAITDKYPTAESLYTITPKEMYDYGSWVLVALIYKGDYGDNSDTLKIVLQKKQSTWTVATKPDITFNKFTYPNIPRTILDIVNDTDVSE